MIIPNLDLPSLLLVLGELFAWVLLIVMLRWLGARAIDKVLAREGSEARIALAERCRRAWSLQMVGLGLLGFLAILGGNAWLVWRGEVPMEWTLQAAQGVSAETRRRFLFAVLKIVGLVIAASVLLRIARRGLDRLGVWAVHFDGIQANDESVERLFASLKVMLARASWLAVLTVSTRVLLLPASISHALLVALKIYLIVSLGRLLWRGLDAMVATVDGLSQKYAHSKELGHYYDRLKPLVPLFRRTLEYLIYLTITSLALLQVEAVAPLANWITRLMRILSYFFLTRVVVEVGYLLTEEVLTRGELTDAEKQRRWTLVPLARSFLQYAAYAVFAVVALEQLGVDPMPFLAGAGIVGLAIGFGAQSLISDMVSGLFILFEGYYLVGDYIEASEARGVVESIDLRTTRIRDDEGRHHILRNGEIGSIVNYSKEFICAVVEVGVAYESDLEHVTKVLARVGEELRATRHEVLVATKIDGVEAYAESSLILRTVTRVMPGAHRDVERDLRRRIKEAFDQSEITIAPTISLEGIPFPMH